MKKIIILTFLVIIVVAFKPINTLLKHKNIINSPVQISTLDSLQGTWYSIEDSLYRISIQNRVLIEDYLDEDSSSNRKFYDIYFSDTLIDIHNVEFNSLRLNDTLKSGNFLVAKNLYVEELWCYQYYGFSKDTSNGKPIFSIADTWAQKKPMLFSKK